MDGRELAFESGEGFNTLESGTGKIKNGPDQCWPIGDYFAQWLPFPQSSSVPILRLERFCSRMPLLGVEAEVSEVEFSVKSSVISLIFHKAVAIM